MSGPRYCDCAAPNDPMLLGFCRACGHPIEDYDDDDD